MNTRRMFPSWVQMLLAVALAVMAAVVVCSTSPAPALAASLTVTKAADTDGGVCDGDCSLREAIASASDGDVITFDGDYTIYLNSTLSMSKTLTVDGSGHAVVVSGDTGGDGTSDVRVFEIGASGVVTLSHLSIVSGTANYSGNTASRYGGGIYNYGTLLVIYSTISGNRATFGGGGICNDQGALTVTHSTLSGNTAGGGGGGIYNDQGTLLVSNSTLSGNGAPSGGGVDNQGTATVQNSTISGNGAVSGGGIRNGFGTLTVLNSTLFDNNASFKGGGYGGIENSGTLYLRNTIIAHSTGSDCGGDAASTDDHNWLETGGCGIAARGDPNLGPLQDNGGPTWTHALLAGSGAIDAGSDTISLNTDQRGVARPQGAGYDIGAYEKEAPRLSIAKSVTPWTDVACHGTVTYTVVLSNNGLETDAAVLLTDTLPAEVTFGSWVISPTNTIRDGNAITWTGAITSGAGVTLAYTAIHSGDCVDVVSNTAWFSGAWQVGSAQAVFVTAEAYRVLLPLVIKSAPLVVATRTVTKAADTGDGVCDGDCSLREALAAAADGDVITFDGDYTIYLNSTLYINKTLTVDGSGHAVVVSGDTGGDGTANVRVFEIGASGMVTLSHLSVVSGVVNTFGGGIYNAGALLVAHCTLSGNTSGAGFGGGRGGGICNAGTLTVTHSTLSGNTALDVGYGGGIYNGSGSTLLVTDSTLSGNVANEDGGGIYNDYGTLTMQHSTLSGNATSYGVGGGVANYRGTVMVQNSTLFGNKAIAGHGGGIYNYGTLTVQNSTLSGNTASWGDGGGVANYRGTVMVQNSTLFGNTADSKGGGIYDFGGTLHLRNTLIASSANGDCRGSTVSTDDYNWLETGGCGIGPSGDPNLGPLQDNGGLTWTHALLAGSGAIDAGNDATCLATDQRGVARPQDGDGDGSVVCDIGAYEKETP